MATEWPNKATREGWEIGGFIEAYARLPHGRNLKVVCKSEKPDYWVVEEATGERFGIEVTSVYLDDRSVPDVHMPRVERPVSIPDDPAQLEVYKGRLVESVCQKVLKARQGYDTSSPVILSVYINEYISIYLSRAELRELVRANQAVFDSIAPFVEVVFWNLANREVLSVRAGSGGAG